MSSQPPNTHDWNAIVARYARTTGVDLTPQTVDELATHLEDLYLAALGRGANERDARRETVFELGWVDEDGSGVVWREDLA